MSALHCLLIAHPLSSKTGTDRSQPGSQPPALVPPHGRAYPDGTPNAGALVAPHRRSNPISDALPVGGSSAGWSLHAMRERQICQQPHVDVRAVRSRAVPDVFWPRFLRALRTGQKLIGEPGVLCSRAT